jgi:hypothetical protein
MLVQAGTLESGVQRGESAQQPRVRPAGAGVGKKSRRNLWTFQRIGLSRCQLCQVCDVMSGEICRFRQ